ncbi:MAG TPA: polyhydroxyalkanoate synthesis repressor PhaR [Micropepsaceae bacterium]|nr:polyhydroxyalkanoate synthesis repressor PhaR [Micropepsaceae bacterium]
MSETQSGAPGPIIIKKYANRRLYNTQTSSYVTLDHLCELVKEGVEFEVHDARTGEDITRQVLAQIIFDEENKGQHLLPIQFLRQLIRFYGDSLQSFVPSYLELSMESFTKSQQEMREKFAEALGGKLGYKDFEQMTRQNIQMFERAMKMFTPFGGGAWSNEKDMPNPFAAAFGGSSAKPRAPESPSPQREDEIRELKDQIAAMRQQIADIAQKK